MSTVLLLLLSRKVNGFLWRRPDKMNIMALMTEDHHHPHARSVLAVSWVMIPLVFTRTPRVGSKSDVEARCGRSGSWLNYP